MRRLRKLLLSLCGQLWYYGFKSPGAALSVVLAGVAALLVVVLLCGWRRCEVCMLQDYGYPHRSRAVNGLFHTYAHEVDFRILLLTYNRAESLNKSLGALQSLEMDGAQVALDVWVDRAPDGSLHAPTLRVARSFRWTRGPVTVHVHSEHVGLYGQWLQTWRPRADWDVAAAELRVSRREMALFLEDDMDVSPHVYRYVRDLHAQHAARTDVIGYPLQDEGVLVSTGSRKGRELAVASRHPLYLYRIPSSWGLVPLPGRWYQFQDWFIARRFQRDFDPRVAGAELQSSWWTEFVQRGTQADMWTMWLIRFCDEHGLLTVYPNFPAHLGREDVSVGVNRKEVGLHLSARQHTEAHVAGLLTEWSSGLISPNRDLPAYGYDGRRL